MVNNTECCLHQNASQKNLVNSCAFKYNCDFLSLHLKYTRTFKNILIILDSSAGNGVLTKATVPIYATGVLTCYIQVREETVFLPSEGDFSLDST